MKLGFTKEGRASITILRDEGRKIGLVPGERFAVSRQGEAFVLHHHIGPAKRGQAFSLASTTNSTLWGQVYLQGVDRLRGIPAEQIDFEFCPDGQSLMFYIPQHFYSKSPQLNTKSRSRTLVAGNGALEELRDSTKLINTAVEKGLAEVKLSREGTISLIVRATIS